MFSANYGFYRIPDFLPRGWNLAGATSKVPAESPQKPCTSGLGGVSLMIRFLRCCHSASLEESCDSSRRLWKVACNFLWLSPHLPFLCADFAAHPFAAINQRQEYAQTLSVVSPNESEKLGRWEQGTEEPGRPELTTNLTLLRIWCGGIPWSSYSILLD